MYCQFIRFLFNNFIDLNLKIVHFCYFQNGFSFCILRSGKLILFPTKRRRIFKRGIRVFRCDDSEVTVSRRLFLFTTGHLCLQYSIILPSCTKSFHLHDRFTVYTTRNNCTLKINADLYQRFKLFVIVIYCQSCPSLLYCRKHKCWKIFIYYVLFLIHVKYLDKWRQ